MGHRHPVGMDWRGGVGGIQDCGASQRRHYRRDVSVDNATFLLTLCVCTIILILVFGGDE